MTNTPLNSVAGFSVGDQTSSNIILANGDITTNNFTATGNSNIGPIGNVTITGGTANYYLQTNGSGSLTWSPVTDLLMTITTAQTTSIPGPQLVFQAAGNQTISDFAAGSLWYRVNSQPSHPGCFRSADRYLADGITISNTNGGWWELRSQTPMPDMFPVSGTLGTFTGDTAAMQACANYVRDNFIGFGSLTYGLGCTDAIYLGTRTYYINTSIDYTDNGSRPGLGIIGTGAGSIISGLLTTPLYPILDMSGVARGRILNIMINSNSSSDVSCCSLLAGNVVGNTGHNNNWVIRDSFIYTNSSNASGAFVMNGGDISEFHNTAFQNPIGAGIVHGDLPAWYFGYAVAAGSSNTQIQLNTTIAQYNFNNPVNLSTALAGCSVIVFAGTGSGTIASVQSYVSGTNTITFASSLGFTPDATTQLAILAVKSAYKTLNNLTDNTSMLIDYCIIEGTTPFVTSVGNYTLRRTYITSAFPSTTGTVYSAAVATVLLTSYQSPAGGGINVSLIDNCRFENEGNNLSLAGVMSWMEVENLNFGCDAQHYTTGGSQVLFASQYGGSFQAIDMFGGTSTAVTVFNLSSYTNVPQTLGSFRGTCRLLPGSGSWPGILGTIGQINWLDLTDSGNAPLEEGRAFAAVTLAGRWNFIPIVAPTASLLGLSPNTTGNPSYCIPKVNLNASGPTLYPTTGGNTAQIRASWAIPAGVIQSFVPFNGVLGRRLHLIIAGYTESALSNLQLQFVQGANTIGTIGGSSFNTLFRYDCQVQIGSTYLGCNTLLFTGNATPTQYDNNFNNTGFSWSSNSQLTINLVETGASANITVVRNSIIELG